MATEPEILAATATADAAQLVLAGVQPGDTLQFQAQVIREGQPSGWSSPVTADIPPLPGPPTLAVGSSRVIGAGHLTPAVLRCKTLAACQGISALLWTAGRRKTLTLWRGTEPAVNTPLTDLDADSMTNASVVITDEALDLLSVGTRPAYAWSPDTRTWTFLPAQPPPMLRRYTINPDLTVQPMEAVFLGNDHTTASDLIVLSDGAVLAIGYRVTDDWHGTYAESHSTLVIGRYDGQNVVVRDGPQVDGPPTLTGQTAIVAAQHPVDGKAWIFSKGDSFHRLSATVIDPTTLEVLASYPDWISGRDGDDNVEGECPHLCAVADPVRGRIVLAYQDQHYEILDRDRFLKGAWITLASIAADGTRTFERIEALVERVWGLAVSVLPYGLLVAARYPLTLTAPYCLDVAVWRQAHGVWSGPIPVGRTNSLYEDFVMADRTVALASGPSVMAYDIRA